MYNSYRLMSQALLEKCPYSYSVQIPENRNEKNSEGGHFPKYARIPVFTDPYSPIFTHILYSVSAYS